MTRVPTNYYSRLKGKTAIVTAAGTLEDGDHVGTGAAIALWFAREGANICIVDIDELRGRHLLERIESDGGSATLVIADILTSEGCARAVASAVTSFGEIDILINNLGANSPHSGWVGGGKIHTLPDDVWRGLIDLNLTSAFMMCKAAIPEMIKRPTSVIINIGSIAAMQAIGSTAYGSAKAALIAFTHELALAYGPDGLRANIVSPGHIHSPMVSSMLDDAGRARRAEITPLGIEGTAWDVAAVALFLASDEARYLTSLSIPVDGGVTQMAPLAVLQAFVKHDSAAG